MSPTRGYFLVYLMNSEFKKKKNTKRTEVHLAIITEPLGRVTVTRINVLEGDGEVN